MFNRLKAVRAIAAAAAVAMLGSLAVTAPAMAEETVTPLTPDATGTITIDNVEAGVHATAYKIAKVNVDGKTNTPLDPEFTWDESVASWVRAKYRSYISDANAVSDVFQQMPSDTDGLEKTEDGQNTGNATKLATFYDDLTSAIANGDTPATPDAAEQTATGDTLTFENLPLGDYLVLLKNTDTGDSLTNGTTVYRPIGVAIQPEWNEKTKVWTVKNATATAKRSNASIDKSINEDAKDHISGEDAKDAGSDTVAIGDEVTFDLRSDVPVFPANAVEKNYMIADAMGTELTLNEGSIKVWGYEGAKFGNAHDEDTPVPADAYTLTVNGKDLDGKDATFTLNFDYEKIRKWDYIHVQYTATVNENAKVDTAIDNTAKLQYTNNPYEQDSHTTIPDKVKVYTYGIKVLKVGVVDGVEKGALTGAEFSLRVNDKSAPIAFVKVGDAKDGHYRKATAEDKAESTVTNLVVGETEDTKGRLTLDGLDKGKYQLVEEKAPADYNKLSAPIDVTIEAERDRGEFTGKVVNQTSGYWDGTVTNRKGRLPNTGSIGTTVFTVGGILLVAAGISIVARKRRS
ncbi:SpaH/EbpB family LPXTG-anchored major pilin [Bifidobacterium samirii]|uniref:Cell surface protein n=1 Tax=Bifidobacterium samirii TaxID=2306974 RepID=A0A430FR81_9BIFI|nr:SpaH/EbpB family LPXTG-anchored major pilin [Bifidobacterium samirii]RSX55335.1 cell surface protein [Bifidobacterium samirii]